MLLKSVWFFVVIFTTVLSQSAKKSMFNNKSQNNVNLKNSENITLPSAPKAVEEITESIIENNIDDAGISNGITENENDMTTLDSNMTGIENVTEVSSNTSGEVVTETINTTVAIPLETTTVSPKSRKKGSKKTLRSRQQSTFCYCDLMTKSCDVNCCCDIECSEADRGVFSKCINDEEVINERNAYHCSANEVFYKSYSPMVLEYKSNDLFCIYNDNIPPKLKNIPYKVYKTDEDFKILKKKYFAWPDNDVLKNISFDYTKSYVYGDKVWLFENSALKLFDIPSSPINMYCNGKITIKYLINYDSKCVTKLSNDTQKFSVYNRASDVYLISSPKDLNDSWIGKMEECPRNVCIPLKAFVCDSYECLPLNMSDDKLTPSCDSSMCKNILTTTKYHLYSNGSSGFTEALVYFGLSVVSIDNVYVEQAYEVQHLWVKKNASDIARALSGNPGYLISKPILISQYISNKDNNKTEETQMLDYFSDVQYFPLRNTLTFPENNKGYCVLSNISYTPVTFGENMQFRCKVVHTISYLYNATFECLSLQDKIVNLLNVNHMKNSTKKLFISTKGNPTSSNDWLPFVKDWSPKKIVGVFAESNKSLICENLMKNVRYSFVFAKVEEPNAKSQLHLFGAHVKYVTADIVSLFIKDSEVSVNLLLTSMFYDITTRQTDEYASGPEFQINLPSDFFYPFTLNSCMTLQPSKVLTIGIFSLYIYFYL